MAVIAPPSAAAVHTGITLDQATSVVFLPLSGIFYNSFQAHCDSATKVAQKLFPDVVENQFSDYQWRIAETHLFNQEAVAHLETLIRSVDRLGIVISSVWRFEKTVAELKEILAKYTFSAFIIDKTPDMSDIEYRNSLPKDQEEYFREIGRPLTSEVSYWLKRHPSITNFVIYESCDSEGLSKTFGDKFIEVDRNKFLTQADVNKALAVFSARAPSSSPVAPPKGITLAQATSVVFLDIDGVLYNNRNDDSTDKIARNLFPDVIDGRYSGYQMDQVHAHLFNQKAVANLEFLIQSVNNLGIVLISQWRENRTIPQLRQIFAKHIFAVFIIDKTPDRQDEEYKSYLCRENDGKTSRASEITYWLKKNPQIINFVIYDDCDTNLSKTFGDKFILVDRRQLLTKDDINKGLGIFSVKV
ncbi:MAG: hypothetical protein JSS10_08225 [Verrucomicrobia bacterium]|nr:hypothetical protein [Verrucomicrobiota bacterium]